MEQNFPIEEVFESAVTIVQNLPKEGPIKPSDELKLKLYAYYKQATHGQNDTPKPKFYQIVESYKWDAWRKLGDMSKEDAMFNYVRELKQIMSSMKNETQIENNNEFEDILGKKFYDYWFNGLKQNLVTTNDTHSESSGGSSVSMLEDTQSAAGDGYKTPTSSTQTLGNQMSDQFALAVLRLQHGLDETTKRIKKIEDQLKISMECIDRLENRTYPKQTQSMGHIASGRGSSSLPDGGCKLIRFLRNIDTIHWFYLSYPMIVYMIFRSIDRRRSRKS